MRVERADVAPTAPFTIDPPTVQRLFGAALNAMPDAEIHFVLYFDEASDALNAASMAIMPAIVRAVQERFRSTDIIVTGGAQNKTGSRADNYGLGLRRDRAGGRGYFAGRAWMRAACLSRPTERPIRW